MMYIYIGAGAAGLILLTVIIILAVRHRYDPVMYFHVSLSKTNLMSVDTKCLGLCSLKQRVKYRNEI